MLWILDEIQKSRRWEGSTKVHLQINNLLGKGTTNGWNVEGGLLCCRFMYPRRIVELWKTLPAKRQRRSLDSLRGNQNQNDRGTWGDTERLFGDAHECRFWNPATRHESLQFRTQRSLQPRKVRRESTLKMTIKAFYPPNSRAYINYTTILSESNEIILSFGILGRVFHLDELDDGENVNLVYLLLSLLLGLFVMFLIVKWLRF